jgi:hypothetical protein
MDKDTLLQFPATVATGAPFTDIETGVRWLVQANKDYYPGMGAIGVDDYWQQPARLTPELVVNVPVFAFIDPTDDTALRKAWDSNHKRDGQPLDFPRFDLAAMPAGVTDHTVTFTLDHYRYLQGVADHLRRSLPAAKQRRDVAYTLGNVEQAIQRVGVTVLRFINAYTTELWRLAIMQGHPTQPPNPYAQPTEQTNPTGIPRLQM